MCRIALVLLLCFTTLASAQPLYRGRGPVIVSPPPQVWLTPPAPLVAERVEQKRDVVLRWNEAALDAIKAERTPPPIAAHHLALLHVAIYDAVSATDPAT